MKGPDALPPLPCENARLNLPPLSDAERDHALTGFINDMLTVSFYAIRNVTPRTQTLQALIDSFAKTKFPSLRVLARVNAYVRFQLTYEAQVRPLTAEEREVEAAARRLTRGFHGRED